MRSVAATLVLAVTVVPWLASCHATDAIRARGSGPGILLWARTYIGPRPHGNSGQAVAISPSGATVFVTGYSDAADGVKDYATVAYSASTGVRLWASRYNGPGSAADIASALAVSPSGKVIFVTGSSYSGPATRSDYATVAYDATTGAQLWVSRYNGPANGHDDAHSVAVSPNGRTVYVTGQSPGTTAAGSAAEDYATVAYRAATGAQLWVSRYNGPANRLDDASSVAVSPDGATVYVTGSSAAGPNVDVATVAYRAATGARLWVSTCRGSIDRAPTLAVSPSGTAVFATEANGNGAIGYNAATGARLWVSRLTGDIGSVDAIAVNPAGTLVYVTGSTFTQAAGTEYATAAYDARTGARAWVSYYANTSGRYAVADAVAVSPSGARVYVTGSGGQSNFITVAYGAATGHQIWARRYQRFGNDWVFASAIAVGPTSGSVYLTGSDAKRSYVTVAYRG